MHQPKDIFAHVLSALEVAFRQLETRVLPPIKKPWSTGFVFRYREQTIQQAIVQKLARMVSGLHAVETLLERGLFQEQGMVQRGLDEINEDIWFLSLGILRNDLTPLHTEFLNYFYAEEFIDPSDIVGSHKSRGMVRREKIRAYIEQDVGPPHEAARAKAIGKVLTKAYSGFIHAASPHIMDMYGGLPPRFDVDGAYKPFRYAEFKRDALNYFLRATQTMALAGLAFGDENIYSSMRPLESEVETEMANQI